MEQSTVNQRLNLIVDIFEKGVKAAFARKAGISPQGAQEILAGRKGDPSFKVLVKILENYPAVDANWLVLGRGKMLKYGILTTLDSATTSAEFIAQYIRHRDGKSDMSEILHSKFDLAQRITSLLSDDSQSVERLKLQALELDYDELVARREKEMENAELSPVAVPQQAHSFPSEHAEEIGALVRREMAKLMVQNTRSQINEILKNELNEVIESNRAKYILDLEADVIEIKRKLELFGDSQTPEVFELSYRLGEKEQLIQHLKTAAFSTY